MPYVVFPYGNSYMYVPAQPVYYTPQYTGHQLRAHNTMASVVCTYGTTHVVESPSTKESWRSKGNKGHFYSTATGQSPSSPARAEETDDEDLNSWISEEESDIVGGSKMLDNMTVEEIYKMITEHLKVYPRVRLSWYNKLLVKVTTSDDFARALDTLELFTQRIIEISPETGTLFIKAACRAGEPKKALKILNATDKLRLWPTLGGIHYLMINFSLNKQTPFVKEAFLAAKKRMLKPNMRTYQIIIRECVDNNLIDDALKYLNMCEAEGIVPNRVTYNILMNGLRKANRPKEILAIRERMDKHGLEINDTTVKFTSLAYMMLADVKSAVSEFLKYPDIKDKPLQFCEKFFEVTAEPNVEQKKCVLDLFDAVTAAGTALPQPVVERIAQLKTSLWSYPLGINKIWLFRTFTNVSKLHSWENHLIQRNQLFHFQDIFLPRLKSMSLLPWECYECNPVFKRLFHVREY